MDRTHCEQVKALLADAPEQGDALPKALSEHASSCDTCQLELVAAGKLTELVAGVGSHLEPGSTPEQLAARAVLASEPGRAGRAGRSRSPWLWAGLGAVAAAGVAAVIAVTSGTSPADGASKAPGPVAGTSASTPDAAGQPPQPPPNPLFPQTAPALAIVRCQLLAAGAEAPCSVKDGAVTTGPSERARVSLSDETTVTLNHGSRLELAAGPRNLKLAVGEAFFDVVRQQGLSSLSVAVPSGRVEVVGTKLTIHARPRMAVVGVVTGKVNAHNGGAVLPVTAGQQAVMVDDNAPVVGPAPNLGAASGWAEKRPTGGVVEDGAAVTGFGTLKARKPGARKDSPERSLRLADHQVKVNVQGLVARTEVTEVFANDTRSTLEGIYTFPLPPGAQIAALDLEVEGRWEHGAIVDRARGDKIWRGVIRNATPKPKRRVVREEWIWVPGPWKDPALMQWKQGNRFELRIFPIPANGSRRVRIAYTQKLQQVPGGRRYVLPLAPHPAGDARADRFGAEVRVGGDRAASDVRFGGYELASAKEAGRVVGRFAANMFKPQGSLIVDVADLPEEATAELTHVSFQDPTDTTSNYAMLNLRPRLPAKVAGDAALQVVVVVDRSYSTQAARMKRSAELVEEVVGRLGATAQVQVLACATRCTPLGDGAWVTATTVTGASLAAEVARLEPIGATRLDGLFTEAAKRFTAGEGVGRRVILIGDGVASTGEVETARLADAAKQALGAARLTTVSLGGEIDASVLTALASAGSGAYVTHGPGSTMSATAWEVASRQRQTPLRDLKLKLPEGTREVAGVPALMWPGEELVVTARLNGAVDGKVVLEGQLDGQTFKREYDVALRPSPHRGNAFVPRLWAEGRIAALQERDDVATRKQVVALSTKHHVLSRHTSLIVLESPAMARAFKVYDTRPAVDWTGEEDMDAALANAKAADGLLSKLSDVGGLDMDAFKGDSMGGLGKALGSKGGFGLGAGGSTGMGGLGSSGSKPRATRSKDVEMKPTSRPRPTKKSTKKKKRAKSSSGALMDPFGDRMRPRRPGRRGGRWAKRVWYRTSTLRDAGSISDYDLRKLQQRKLKLAERPDSRERTRDLVRWHVRLGDLKAARSLALKWLERDRMDIDALTELAGIAALEGKLKRSELLLASIVDIDRMAEPAHDRLHELYVAAGEHNLACAQATARALLVKKSDPERVAAAARCAGPSDRARFLERLEKARDRKKVDKLLAKPSVPASVRGKIRLDANWQGNAQIDLVAVTPKGRVVSWQGGDKRTTSALSQSLGAEQLGLRAREVGRYRVYAVYRGTSDSQGPMVTGSARVKSYKNSRRKAFSLRPGERAPLFDVRIQRKSRMEFR